MFGSRMDLARLSAALDADPFADPVRAGPFEFCRREARRLERELTAKFRTHPIGSRAGDCPTVSTGHPRNDHATPCVVPEPHRTPRISGSGFRLSPFDHGDTYVRN